MALKLPVRKLVAPVKPVIPETKLVEKKPRATGEEKVTASATVRLNSSLATMCEEMQETFEENRSEVIKKAIRLLYSVSTAASATLIVTNADGTKNTVRLMDNGKSML